MQVQELLLHALEDLLQAEFDKFKWYLTMNILDSCNPLAKSCLENVDRLNTVRKMLESYGEASAVKITVEILKKIPNIEAAEKLKKAYAATEGQTAASSTSSSASAPPAAPVTISAQQGGVVIAPMVYGSTSGSWNINTN